MNKKIVFAYIINVPLTYVLVCIMGWMSYFIVNGNPTFFIPLRILLCIYFILHLIIIIAALRFFKLYKFKRFLIMGFESLIVFILLGILLHA
ncbi:hypothetical protein SAMN05421821_108165 [Mucilaginibacter lappiensis]|uniref:Membrane protein YdbS with pleckstrin-like domain n=1 Tax=Mucilaginibacter lappiensis TaxID=354630 RepID=A0ABR6PJS8_9SPHI|nr:membrane protein YdbS with pleckstrin-like domain [Mucilaginibacter lappiensis]SIR55005.1 hypothetical protein SAMN05421821_108165 [Mucilaginibacter lappiensis]